MTHAFKDIKKILVIKLRHIGDVLLTVPVFRALREIFPQAYIAALVNSGTEDVLISNPFIDELIVFDRSIKKMNALQKYSKELSFLKMIRSKGFDMTIDLTSGDRAAIISVISGARYRLAYITYKGFLFKRYLYTHLAQKDSRVHKVKQNLDILKQIGLSYTDTSLLLNVSDTDKSFIREAIRNEKNIVHIHPVARYFHKCWKDEYMARVIDYLIDRGFKPVITSSNDYNELEKAHKIMSFTKRGFVDLTGKTSLKQLAALSKMSRFFIGIDSGPMHIAAAVGIPVIAIFGPSSETLWAPLCEKKLIISKPLPCRLPCKHKGTCKTYECINSITPEEVIPQIEDFIRSIH
jgi:heptosyltransferase-3